MNQKAPQRRGLGRGLGSLIPTGPAAEPTPAPVPTGPDWIGRIPEPGAGEPDGLGGAQQGADGAADGAAAAASSTADPGAADLSVAGHAPTDAGAVGPAATESGLRTVEGAYFAEIPVAAVAPNPRQPRQVFDEEAMAELVHSVQEVGLLQPVVVRPVADGRYELVMGERRWRATLVAGLETIPAIVRETGDDALLRDALLENLHRAQLNPLEEAAAYQQLLDDFGCTHEELAARIGRSRPQISNTLRLLRLTPAVQRRVAAGVLSAGHARTLLSVDDAEAQDRLAGRVVAEGISVRGLEELVTVGGADSATPRVRRANTAPPGAEEIAARLGDLYETRVRVDMGRRKGRISIEFASIEDLERIVAAMDPSYRPSSD